MEAQAPRVILFDLDGTLVDTLPDLLSALNMLLTEMDRRVVTADELRGWVGDGSAALVERSLAATGGHGEAPAAASVARFLSHYKQNVAVASRAYPGVEETLRDLRAAGYQLGVCTNKPTALAVELLTSLGLSQFFAAVVGGDAVVAKKPHPEHILATLNAVGARGCKALMVGDSANDVAAARAAGIPVVVVSFGYSRTPPVHLGADAVIDDFADLPVIWAATSHAPLAAPMLPSSANP